MEFRLESMLNLGVVARPLGSPRSPKTLSATTSTQRLGTIASNDRPVKHLNQVELSRRWTISPRTLERWRWLGEGPRYLKIGGRVVYRLEDIESYEQAQMREGAASTPQSRE